MDRLRSKTGYKISVIVIFAVALLVTIAAAVGAIYMYEEEYYGNGSSFPKDVSYIETHTPRCYIRDMLDYKIISESDIDKIPQNYIKLSELDGKNLLILEKNELTESFYLKVRDDDGKVLFENGEKPGTEPLGIGLMICSDDETFASYLAVSGSDAYYSTASCLEKLKTEYLSRSELASYASERFAGSAEPIDEFLHSNGYESRSDIPSDSDVICFKSGEREYAANAEDILCDLAWARYQNSYHNYGRDSDGRYYVSRYVEAKWTNEYRFSILAAPNGKTLPESLSLSKQLYDFLYPTRFSVIVIAALSVLAAAVCFILMLFFAGWRKGYDEPQTRRIDKLPYEIYLAIYAIAAAVIFYILDETVSFDGIFDILTFSGIAVVCVALGCLFCAGTARRIKTGTLLKNTLIARLIKLLRTHSSVWTVLAGGAVYAVLSLALILSDDEFCYFLWAVMTVCALLLLACCAGSLFSLFDTTAKIAQGDTEQKINTEKIPVMFRKHAENINSMGGAVNSAVDEKLKSERMKTDLIANVSHDIKTPLTSVINYIDLLGKCDIKDPEALEYIEVLNRQSGRLSRLLEDIVEASRASSGCITVNAEPSDLGELVSQAVGEYSERLEKSGVTPVVSCSDDARYILADGRLLWRIFDNLLSNICKYSQDGTRAYIETKRSGGNAVISFRSVSREALNISPDALMERFVRGDRSRQTDGSGLGLSIAKSLAELQNGKLELFIDGDLFRAEVTLPCCDAPEKEQEETPALTDGEAMQTDTLPEETDK